MLVSTPAAATQKQPGTPPTAATEAPYGRGFVGPVPMLVLFLVVALATAVALYALWAFWPSESGKPGTGVAEHKNVHFLWTSRMLSRENLFFIMVALAGALGGLAGVLLPPLSGTFTSAFGTTDVLISAFTAAVLGGMTSVPGAFVGSLDGTAVTSNVLPTLIAWMALMTESPRPPPFMISKTSRQSPPGPFRG